MTRLLPLLLCLLALAPWPVAACVLGPQAGQSVDKVRDLAEIRRSGVLRVLVNQSRTSSGEVKGEAIGVEYVRLRAFEQFLNRGSKGSRISLKIIPKPRIDCLVRYKEARETWLHPESCWSSG